MYEYLAKVIRVVDGDTYDVMVDLGFNIKMKIRIRLNGIDTPEIYRPSCDAELEHGREAKLFVEQLILNEVVTIKTYKMSLNRYVADVKTVSAPYDLVLHLKNNNFEKKDSYE